MTIDPRFFKKDFIRLYEVIFIILISIFANRISNVSLHNLKMASIGIELLQNISMLMSALSVFKVYSTLYAKWEDKLRFDDPIECYNKSFTKDQIRPLYRYCCYSVVLFILAAL